MCVRCDGGNSATHSCNAGSRKQEEHQAGRRIKPAFSLDGEGRDQLTSLLSWFSETNPAPVFHLSPLKFLCSRLALAMHKPSHAGQELNRAEK